METHDINEEDEDIVIQGSALHKHLSELGYTDFESILVSKKNFKQEHYWNIDFKNIVKNAARKIYTNLFSFYSWVIQEEAISKEQLNIILTAETLLNDHFFIINGFKTKCNNSFKKLRLQELILSGGVFVSSIYILLCKYRILPIFFVSSAICYGGYIKYLRFYANRNLKNIISLQNELFLMCKDGLKILQRDYKVKMDLETCFQQFSHFLGEKLQYLESLQDTLLKFMGNISHLYYKCSLLIVKLLPPNVLNEELFTKFEDDAFEISGKVDYQALKKLYHIYLLVQSEMLYLLAITYDSTTWIASYQKIPEMKLTNIIHVLVKELVVHRVKLSEVIDAYRTCKTKPIRYKPQDKAKWCDPTVQLDLASYKLQLAYNQVFSTFKNIEDSINQDISIDNETADILMQKLDEAFKEINTARNLAEFVILLMARSKFNDLRRGQSVVRDTTINQNSDLPIIIDSDPQILDEVFEEYIKQEYLNSTEDVDEYPLQQRKLDKLLVKNFMAELKEALIDKHKSMSEREFKALQRMYKNVSRDSALSNKDNNHIIPVPPPMPSYYIWSTLPSKTFCNSDDEKLIISNYRIKNDNIPTQRESNESSKSNNFIKALKEKNIFNVPSIEASENRNEESVASLSQILLETRAKQFITELSSSSFYEETFIGSGENSEEEIVDNEIDENNKTSQ